MNPTCSTGVQLTCSLRFFETKSVNYVNCREVVEHLRSHHVIRFIHDELVWKSPATHIACNLHGIIITNQLWAAVALEPSCNTQPKKPPKTCGHRKPELHSTPSKTMATKMGLPTFWPISKGVAPLIDPLDGFKPHKEGESMQNSGWAMLGVSNRNSLWSWNLPPFVHICCVHSFWLDQKVFPERCWKLKGQLLCKHLEHGCWELSPYGPKILVLFSGASWSGGHPILSWHYPLKIQPMTSKQKKRRTGEDVQISQQRYITDMGFPKIRLPLYHPIN